MDITNFIFSYLKEKLPSVNWNIGSTVRELIAQPMVTIAERAKQALNKQVSALSVQSFIENAEEYADDINTIFNELDLDTNNTTISEGVITILTHSATPSAIYKNTALSYNDQVVTVIDDTYPSLIASNNPGFTQLRQIGHNAYMFDVKVRASSHNTYLAQGTALIWDEAPNDIYEITVTSPISGGRMSMTLQEKAQSIKDYIAPNVLTLNDGISKHLRSVLPDIVVDAKYATDISDSKKSYLYIKTAKAPSNYYITVTGYKDESGLYRIQTKELGIISVIAAYKGDEQINIQQVQITNNDIYCTLEYNGEPTESFELQVYGLSDASRVQSFLDGYTLGSPFNIEVKAPATFELKLEFTYTGQELSAQHLKNICELVQFYGLDKTLTDAALQHTIETYGAFMQGSGIYTLISPDGSTYKQKYAPAIYSSAHNSYALYTGLDKVIAHHV